MAENIFQLLTEIRDELRAFDETLGTLGRTREALARTAARVEALKAKPQPWPEVWVNSSARMYVGKAPDFVAEDKLLYEETAKKAASRIEEAYAAAAREPYGKTGTFVVPPDASKCRHAQLANGAMPVPFCEVCGSFDLRCALGAPGTSRAGFGPAPVERRSTADYDLRGESRPAPTPEDIRRCSETAKPVRIRPSEDDCA